VTNITGNSEGCWKALSQESNVLRCNLIASIFESLANKSLNCEEVIDSIVEMGLRSVGGVK